MLWAVDCTGASKITIQVEHYLVSGSWKWSFNYRLRLDGASGAVGGNIVASNNTWSNGYALASPSGTTWNRVTLSTWNYTWTTVLDLVNKTEVVSLTWQTDITATLSDSDIASIRTYKDIQIYYDNIGNYNKSIYIKVEY